MELEKALMQADVYAESEEILIIDNDLRTITIPSSAQTVGVESDEDVRRLNFQMPKQYGEVDLSEFNIRINFVNANNQGDVYAVTDKQVTGDNITFSWLVGRNALAYRGNIRFIVCLKKTDAEGVVQQEFNTTIAQLTVLEGLETTEAVVAENPDIIEQILARLDELEENGGGGTVDPEQIKQAVNGYLEEHPVSGMTAEQEQQLNQNTTDVADLKSALEQIEGGGWSSTQIDLFEAFTNVIAYTSPDANSIVSSLISSLRSGSSDNPEGSFSIIYVLSNVTSSSKDNSIKSGEPYNTTLTANPGYELESVIVKMGGSDITSTAYSDGEITISAVTGNIVITASAVQSSASGQLPQDGLVDYFDFRNKTYTAGSGGLYYMNSDFGNGMLYSWANQSDKQGDNIGLKGATGNYTTERATGYPVTDNFPSTRTVCLFGKGGPSVPNSIGLDSTLSNKFLYRIQYRATDKTTKSLPNESIQYPEGFTEVGYNASFVIVNQNILKVYFNDTLHKTVDGNEIDDFESWDISPLALTSFSNYGTAYAIYNKELSEVEIVEALEFFKTLEVSE